MVYRNMNQITAWSFSRFSDYDLCPFKAKCKHVLRIKEPGNAAMDRGGKVHDDASMYIKNDLTKIPLELKYKTELFKRLRKMYRANPDREDLIVEDTWAFRRDWSRTTWDDWNECWLRVKLDCAELQDKGSTLLIYDWKTGKFRSEEADLYYTLQLELYAVAGFTLYPDVKEIQAQLIYLDACRDFPITFTRQKDFLKLKRTWESRVRPMLKDKKFAPRPNQKCIWCHYRKSNKANGGGQCKY